MWLTTGPSLSPQRVMLLATRVETVHFCQSSDQDDDADSTSLELSDNLVFLWLGVSALWSSALGGAQWPGRVVTAPCPAHSASTLYTRPPGPTPTICVAGHVESATSRPSDNFTTMWVYYWSFLRVLFVHFYPGLPS